MRVFVAGIATETNTFASLPTGLGGFQATGMRRRSGGQSAIYAPLEARLVQLAAAGGHELAFGLMAFAQPLGPTVQAVWEVLRDELLADLRASLPVQAVILPLHGAMVAEACDDCEGELIEHVRAIVGPDVPIGVELDLHCHVSERMLTQADLLVAYKEYPHTDVLERLGELWELTIATAEGRARPVTAVADCRMVSFWHTTREPMAGFVQRLKALEARHGGDPRVLSVSFGHGFPWGDVADNGAKVWVVADGDRALAARVAQALRAEIWRMREQTHAAPVALDGVLDALQAQPAGSKPLVIADRADNAGGGAMSDSTFVLRRLVERGIGGVALGAFWDLGAVRCCLDAGVGARFALRVGGKCGPASGEPVDLEVTVRAIAPAHTQRGFSDAPQPCGPSVWVSTAEGLDLVLVSERQQVLGTDLFTGLGIDLADRRAIVVKSSQHFHAAFAPLASAVHYVDTPGLLRIDMENLPFVKRSLRYWPRVADPWEVDAAVPHKD
jgi:microcystin degradation protein MlrC